MPKFAQEFGGQNRKLDPKLPAKKRLPQEMIAAGRGFGNILGMADDDCGLADFLGKADIQEWY